LADDQKTVHKRNPAQGGVSFRILAGTILAEAAIAWSILRTRKFGFEPSVQGLNPGPGSCGSPLSASSDLHFRPRPSVSFSLCFGFLPRAAVSVLLTVVSDFRNQAPRAVILGRLATSPLTQSIKPIISGPDIRFTHHFTLEFHVPLSPRGDPVALKPPLPWRPRPGTGLSV